MNMENIYVDICKLYKNAVFDNREGYKETG